MYVSTRETYPVPLPVSSPRTVEAYLHITFPKLASKLIKRFKEDMQKSRSELQTLSNRKVLKLLHYPLTFNTVFVYMIEERVTLLEKNKFCVHETRNEWNALKHRFAQIRLQPFKNEEFKNDLKEFIDRLKNHLLLAKIDSNEFDLSLNSLNLVSSYPHVGDIALCSLLETSLHNLSPQRKGKFLLPTSAVCQSLELMIGMFQIQMPWIETLGNNLVSDWSKGSKSQTLPTCSVGQVKVLLDQIESYIRLTKQSISQLKIVHTNLISSQLMDKSFLDRQLLLIEEIRLSHIEILLNKRSDQALLQFLQDRESFFCAADFYLYEPFEKCKDILNSVGLMQSSLATIDVTKRKPYLETILPIIEESKTLSPPSRKTQKKKPKKKKKAKANIEHAKGKEKEEISPLKLSPSVVVQPLAIEKSKNKLQDISLRLFGYSSKTSLRAENRKHIINAAWHIEKVGVIQEILEGALDQADYMNLLASLSMHAALSLEQMISFQIKNRKPTFSIKTHNLKILHSELKNENLSKAVNRLYLASYWARYPLEEFRSWSRFATFHDVEIPILLESLTAISSASSDIKEDEFKEYCTTIIKEFTVALASITSFAKEPIPVDLDEAIQPSTHFDNLNFKNLIDGIKILLANESSEQESLKLQECLMNIEMLERTLKSLGQSPNREQFAFYATRIVFLVQESMDHLLHALEARKSLPLTRTHDIRQMAERLSIELPATGGTLHRLSNKLKYPFSMSSENSYADNLVDMITSLRLHPHIDDSFEGTASVLPYWKLPVKGISRENISANLLIVIDNWQKDAERVLGEFS